MQTSRTGHTPLKLAHRRQFTTALSGLLLAAAIVAGCGRSPTSPPAPLAPTRTAGSVAGTTAQLASAEHLNPTELQARGWICFRPPVANRIVCGRPNQGRPTIGNPPPDDRPATFTFLVFDGGGLFVGTELLIRTDLYNGQLCESTGQPFIFRALIGYYECVRTIGS
jgi:hypothetical protein